MRDERRRIFIEGIDYYVECGRWVFTAKYLQERGYCCKNGCRHCPYRTINDEDGKEPAGQKPSSGESLQ